MRLIYLVIGFISLGLGVIGAMIPLLPSFPFLMVSAFCFSRSSEKINLWFKNTKLYKNNLESFIKGDGMNKHQKLRIISMISIVMFLGFYMMQGLVWPRIILAVVWIGHMLYFAFGVKSSKS